MPASHRLGAYLKSMRQRIPRDVQTLGTYERLSSRRGCAVTQEELAEAVDISRGWYGLLESGAAIHASTRLLARIADALMLNDPERAEFFQLALPEMSTPCLQPSSSRLLDTFQALRRIMCKVWVASSEDEVLATVTDALAEHFEEADFVGNYRRVNADIPEFNAVAVSESFQKRVKMLFDAVAQSIISERFDEIMLHAVLIEPAHAGLRRELLGTVRPMLERSHISGNGSGRHADYLDAHVCSNNGFQANIFAASLAHGETFSALDRAMLNTLADLASIALSDPSVHRDQRGRDLL